MEGVEITNFFLARSPEAPSMTKTVFSCISRGVDMLSRLWLVDGLCDQCCLTVGNLSSSLTTDVEMPEEEDVCELVGETHGISVRGRMSWASL